MKESSYVSESVVKDHICSLGMYEPVHFHERKMIYVRGWVTEKK